MASLLDISHVAIPQSTTNPRKRKKRASVAGASADCFRCAQRNTTCDRRRPYCSRCLESGEDCSGYKTQLTWGVGVASRGKLRGLSLPIAGTQQTTPFTLGQKTKKRRESKTTSTPELPSPAQVEQTQGSNGTQFAPALPTRTTSDYVSLPVIASTSREQGCSIWDPTLFSAPHEAQHIQLVRTPALDFQQGFNQLSAQNEGIHAVALPEPSAITGSWRMPETVPIARASQHTSTTHQSINTSNMSYSDQPNSFLAGSELVPSTQPGFTETARMVLSQNGRSFDGLSMLLQAGESMQLPHEGEANDIDEEIPRNRYDECAVSDDYSLGTRPQLLDTNFGPTLLSGISNIGKTVRMQYLINYYTEVISPVIVAFDSPTNPFRTQILRLAESSETLQHAIAALAASNLRQRRGIGLLSTGKTAPARRSSFAHVHLTNEYAQSILSPEEQMREETLHKRLAIVQLNQQLSHPVLRRDDATLATLLMLCLFHVCDSGIAKFQTQFAGVRKLLALRGDDVKIGNEDSRWMSRLFTWYDALASTVNDRERQISGQLLDMSALGGDWALENLAGIDGQLFKAISKLSRLNLLQQGKTVHQGDCFVPMPISPAYTTDAYSMLDGNGWRQSPRSDGLSADSTEPDTSQAFWREWHVVRQELLSWHLDTTLFDSLSRESCYLTMEQRADLENISQSFRYSALLYLERLAQPGLPSSDEAIQRWVRKSLSHIKEVISDVYLLWPLFITGTECIDEEGKNIIRGRCADIQKDSGFVNNASCLQLLEKVWRANSSKWRSGVEDASVTNSSTSFERHTDGTFVFRDVMIKEAARTEGEGEYIVI
ncbi:hypothetical protein LTR64_003065 [Lithohypha guttulata]|uniref:uncharacterized protein n=1 Tax=Lithohypha guttulata TaxID=1690604 RepID=UPI002DDF5406|nr:hypothetical protein LTR51_000712 [Lithohypha guttulata]